MDVIAMITAVAGAVKSVFGFQEKRLDLKNAGDVKAAAVAQNEVSADDKTSKAIANNDLDELRKEASED